MKALLALAALAALTPAAPAQCGSCGSPRGWLGCGPAACGPAYLPAFAFLPLPPATYAGPVFLLSAPACGCAAGGACVCPGGCACLPAAARARRAVTLPPVRRRLATAAPKLPPVRRRAAARK